MVEDVNERFFLLGERERQAYLQCCEAFQRTGALQQAKAGDGCAVPNFDIFGTMTWANTCLKSLQSALLPPLLAPWGERPAFGDGIELVSRTWRDRADHDGRDQAGENITT